MFRDFFLGFIKIHILHHAADGEFYGAAMMSELARHGYEVGPSTLYPILHGMEQAGWLQREERVVSGRVRKYYTATPAGRVVLAELRGRIRELVDEVLEGHGPGTLAEEDLGEDDAG